MRWVVRSVGNVNDRSVTGRSVDGSFFFVHSARRPPRFLILHVVCVHFACMFVFRRVCVRKVCVSGCICMFQVCSCVLTCVWVFGCASQPVHQVHDFSVRMCACVSAVLFCAVSRRPSPLD